MFDRFCGRGGKRTREKVEGLYLNLPSRVRYEVPYEDTLHLRKSPIQRKEKDARINLRRPSLQMGPNVRALVVTFGVSATNPAIYIADNLSFFVTELIWIG